MSAADARTTSSVASLAATRREDYDRMRRNAQIAEAAKILDRDLWEALLTGLVLVLNRPRSAHWKMSDQTFVGLKIEKALKDYEQRVAPLEGEGEGA